MATDCSATTRRHRGEITLRGLLLGLVLTVVLAAANVFMGLRSGITFSSSIPAAVMSMGVLRALGGASMLENNIVQTQASASGTLCNVILVLPALAIVGIWHGFPFWQTMLVCLLGGWYGVLFSIPLRRTLVLEAALPFPEGVAAAEVLHAGQKGGGGGLGILGVGALGASLVNVCTDGLKLLAPNSSVIVTAAGGAFRLCTGYSLALVGVGYLVGIAACVSLLVGVLLAWGVFVPWLTAHGHPGDAATGAAGAAMGVWTAQVRMVGAGIIGVGAVWSVISLYRPMIDGLRGAIRSAAQRRGGGPVPERIDRDVPIGWVGIGCGVLAVPLAGLFWSFAAPAFPQLGAALGGSLVIGATLFTILFGFLMATACGYMAGLLGSSSSPISGIAILAATVIALLLMLILPAQGGFAAAFAIFIAAVIVTTSSIANDNLQDLKTGALVDASPVPASSSGAICRFARFCMPAPGWRHRVHRVRLPV